MKRSLLLFLCLLFTCPTISCQNKTRSVLTSEVEVVKVPNEEEVFDNLQQVENKATVIVEAIAEECIGQNINGLLGNNVQKELPKYGYTKWKIKVTKIFKGSVIVGDELTLLLDYYILNEVENQQKLVTFTSLKPPTLNKEYILFLEYDKKREGYRPVCDYEGMYPMPNKELKDKIEANKLQQSDLDVFCDETLKNLLSLYSKIATKYFY